MTDKKLNCIDDNGIERLILPIEPGDSMILSSDGVFLAETQCCCCDLLQIASELSPKQMIRVAHKLLDWGYKRKYTKEIELLNEQEGKTTQEAAQS